MRTERQPTTVGDLMALDPIVVKATAPLAEAAELLDRHHISGLPVVDGGGSLVGVVSQTDLVRARSTEYLWSNWPGLAVRHLMTSPAVTVTRSTPLEVAAVPGGMIDLARPASAGSSRSATPRRYAGTTDRPNSST